MEAVIRYTRTQANNVPGPHIEPLLPTTTSDRAAIAAGAGTQEPSLAFRARHNRWDAADSGHAQNRRKLPVCYCYGVHAGSAGSVNRDA